MSYRQVVDKSSYGTPCGKEVFEAETVVRLVWSVDQVACARCLDAVIVLF